VIADFALPLAVLLGGAVAASLYLVRRRRRRWIMAKFLDDDDPAIRRIALGLLKSEGIQRFGTLLRWRTTVETDPEVISALVEIIEQSGEALWQTPEGHYLYLWASSQRSGDAFDGEGRA
jgi:hypothetical protein